MPFTTRVVSMPRWSTPIGCTKLVLSIIVLAFVSACIAIWGGYLAFAVTIFTASLSLFSFAYYMIALSFRPQLYNKWLILVLEATLTFLWFTVMILLSGWTNASADFTRWTYDVPGYASTTYDTAVGHNRRDLYDESSNVWSSQSNYINRRQLEPLTGQVGVYAQDAHNAATILASISAGLAGFAFILYAVTLATFSMNFTKATNEPIAPTDIETQTQTPVQPPTLPSPPTSTSNTATIHPDPLSSSPPTLSTPSRADTFPTFSAPLRVDTLPKDFEPKPQTQTHYLTPADAAEAGIEPPTPVLKAQQAQRKKEEEEQRARDMVKGKGKHVVSGDESMAGGEEKGKEREDREVVPTVGMVEPVGPIGPLEYETRP